MSTDTFRRHTRACVDRATHLAFASTLHHPDQRTLFECLLRIARARSDLMANPPTSRGDIVQIAALRNMATFEGALVRDAEQWSGATGHPLHVVDSLARHIFGRYPTPRFLASAWFGDDTPALVERRSWFVAHARGQRFRSLLLPLEMTRRMEDIFLHTPDHVRIDHALRRAEVLGLGGTSELATAIVATQLGTSFDDAKRWRVALTWLVGCGGSIDLAQLRPLVDFLHAHLRSVALRGRTFVSLMRMVREWHGSLGRAHVKLVSWPRSRWNPIVVPVAPRLDEPRDAEWSLVELTDSHALVHEGRAMRHCVSTYASACVARQSSIWSLRHRWRDEGVTRSVFTIEVRPDGMIVQVRAKANGRASGVPLEHVLQWAARERLRFHHRRRRKCRDGRLIVVIELEQAETERVDESATSGRRKIRRRRRREMANP